MADIIEQIEASYAEIVKPLENYSGNTRTITGMKNYLSLFGEVMKDFAESMNTHHDTATNLYPNRVDEIEEFIHELKNKLVETYKPK